MSDQKFIVYDWNGTLLDDIDVVLDYFIETLRACNDNRAFSLDILRQHYDVPLTKFYANMGLPTEKIPVALSAFQDVCKNKYPTTVQKVSLFHGVTSLLNTCQQSGLSQIVLSNFIVAPIEFQLDRHHVLKTIDAVLAHKDDQSQSKWGSKADWLKAYMAEKNLRGENGLIVGDSPEEMDIARSFGLQSVATTTGYVSESRLHAARPDHLIHAITELPALLHAKGWLP